jgi:signal peptidase I
MTDDGYETSEGPAVEPTVAEAYSSEENSSVTRWLIETALLVALAFLLAQGIKSFVVQPFVIPTGSMIPTIEIGDYVLAEKLTFRFSRPPQPGDVVVFDDPNEQHPQLIKRVIATAGQQVDVKDGAVYVDGSRMDEPYVHGKPTLPGDLPLPVIVPQGEVWLMGDNRPNSGDSRYFGPRPLDSVRGRAFWKYWPPSQFGALD